MSDQQICQVAICGHNAARLRDWYRDVFGMVRGGKIFSAPPLNTDRIQGISPNPVETVSWLVDRQDYFQLEFFQFYRPKSRLRPQGWRPCDIGYSLLGIHTTEFDQTVARLVACSDRETPAPHGPPGDRRLCVRDPEGNWLEIRERDPLAAIGLCEQRIVRPEVPAAARFMRISVPELEPTRAALVDAMGLSEVEGGGLHTPGDEALWGLAGARIDTVLLRGRNFLVELVKYHSNDPKPRPPGYQISDQGFMNIAMGYRSTAEFDRSFARACSAGMRPNGAPVDAGIFRVMYVNDPQDFSVEMLNARQWLWSLSGFNPAEPYVANEVSIRAPAERVWQRLLDHGNMGSWSPCKSRILRPGEDRAEGPGCLRELSWHGLRATEEVVAWEEGRHYRYRLRTGAPFTWHQGDFFLREREGAIEVRWVIRFESWLPLFGRIAAWAMQRVCRRALGRLQQQLETECSTS